MGKVLVTGGAGYIGSHVVKALGEKGYDIIVYDNLSTGNQWAVLYGELVIGDILDLIMMRKVFINNKIDVVIHLAACIIAPESVEQPLKYYMNNVCGTLNLLQVMAETKVNKFIFSSTAAVYGIPQEIPVTENSAIAPISPYGQSKAIIEKIINDIAKAADLQYITLRCFNVAGADLHGRIGEGKSQSTHLITSCVRTALNPISCLNVYGNDYPTTDGTGIRDYIHVDDLASAFTMSLQYLLDGGKSLVCNCGYGRGYSVLEVMEATKKLTGVNINVAFKERRPGDPPILIADSQKLKQSLNWQPRYNDLHCIIESALRWEQKIMKNGNFIVKC